MDGWVSPLTGICFDLSNGPLEIYSPTGDRFERPAEYHLSAQLAKLDAENARHEAAEAKREATEKDRRIAILAEKLRALGIDPDA